MKLKVYIPIFAFMIGCKATNNPYYKMSVGLPHVYYNDIANKVYKIENETLIEGNKIKVIVPDELGGIAVKGDATYEIVVNQKREIQKITLVAIVINESIRNNFILYQRYNPAKRNIEKPNVETELFNNYFTKQISKLKFKQISPPALKNIVYCNFIF